MVIFVAFSYGNSIAGYHEYVSPNKLYLAQVSIRDTDSILIVKNQKTGAIEASMTILLTPILHLQWSPDSRSIVLVQHLARSSLASIINHQSDGWVKYDCEPKIDGDNIHFFVVGIKFLKKSLLISYGISKDNNVTADFQRYAYDVNCQTGMMTLTSATSITLDAFIKLRKKEESNWIK